jgi:dTMP kinase
MEKQVSAWEMQMSARGRFITLEGGEGAGKSAQTRRLATRLQALGVEIVATREPGGTPHAERLRDLILSGALRELGPEAEAIAFAAARIDHVDERIRPALERGCWVISDRFADSTRAYQGAAGKLGAAFVERLERIAVGDARPDLTLILDIDPEQGLARAARRSGAADRFEREGLEFHETLRHAFLSIAQAEPDRCAVIAAGGGEETVAKAIWAEVSRRLAAFLPGR